MLMLKFLLGAILLLVLWYILAPLFTPAALRAPRRRVRRDRVGRDVIDVEGKLKE